MKLEHRRDSRSHATSRGCTFVVGPQGAGATPGDAVLAGRCRGIGHDVRQLLHERGLAPHGFDVVAEAQSTPDRSRRASIAVW